MTGFRLHLQDATRTEVLEDIETFVGEDRSGSFGILPGHARLMTSLVFGLARFRRAGGSWQYLALPGALLYFRDNELTLSTRHYIVDEDYSRISTTLGEQLAAEETEILAVKASLRRMEDEALRRMWRLGQD
jgi:F-type H+-transporting ATPase subunit epsilon